MSWDDDFEYSNGANGSCQDCGAATDQPWHAYCSDCYAEQQGWTRHSGDEDDHQDDDASDATVERLVSSATRQAGHTAAWLGGYHAGYQQGIQDASSGRAT